MWKGKRSKLDIFLYLVACNEERKYVVPKVLPPVGPTYVHESLQVQCMPGRYHVALNDINAL